MALTNLALFGSAFCTPIVVGKMTHTIGYRWTFYFIAIFSAVLLPFVVLFVPETAFKREAYLDTDISSLGTSGYQAQRQQSRAGHELSSTSPVSRGADSQEKPLNGHPSSRFNHHNDDDTDDPKNPDDIPIAYPPKTSFARSLLPFNGRKTSQPFLKLLLRPFPLFLHPAILWASLIQGMLIGWTVLIGVVLAAIFLGPPLFFDEVKTGYMYTGPFVGAILGFAVSGLLSDWSARYMTKRNQGVYEPEFRIVLVIPQFICGCAGLYGFGITSAQVGRYGWFWPDFFFALEVAGMIIGAVSSALYVVDAYRTWIFPLPLSPRPHSGHY